LINEETDRLDQSVKKSHTYRSSMIPEITAGHILARSPDVLSTEAGGLTAIMSLSKGRYYSLDPIATDVWRRLAAPVELGQLATAVAAGYAGDPEKIEAGLGRFLEQMLQEGLIEAAAPPLL
jgi:hypothetical protein